MSNELGKFLIYKRGKQSLRKYADYLGISHAYLNILEKGKDPNTKKEAIPGSDVIKKIAKKTGVSIDCIFAMISGIDYNQAIETDKINNDFTKASHECLSVEDIEEMNNFLNHNTISKNNVVYDELEILFQKHKDILTDEDKETMKFLIEKRKREIDKQNNNE